MVILTIIKWSIGAPQIKGFPPEIQVTPLKNQGFPNVGDRLNKLLRKYKRLII